MKVPRSSKKIRRSIASQAGITMMETAVALAVLGITAVTFLSGLATTSRATIIADEKTTAISLAQTQMEWAKKPPYIYDATGYAPASLPGSPDYLYYSANITAQSLNIPDDGIQKITVTIYRGDKTVITLEGYKVDR